jgi:hypothetical protein
LTRNERRLSLSGLISIHSPFTILVRIFYVPRSQYDVS